MNAILGMTDLALSEDFRPPVRDYLQTAKESGELLLECSTRSSTSPGSRRGASSSNRRPSASQDPGAGRQALGVRAHEKGLSWHTTCPPTCPIALAGDPLRLARC